MATEGNYGMGPSRADRVRRALALWALVALVALVLVSWLAPMLEDELPNCMPVERWSNGAGTHAGALQ